MGRGLRESQSAGGGRVRWVNLMTPRDWNASTTNSRASRIAIRSEERPSLDEQSWKSDIIHSRTHKRVVTKNDPGLTVGWSEKGVSINADSRESTTRASRVPRRHCSPRACPRTTATHTSECHVSEPLAGGALTGQGRRAFRRVPERPRFRKLAALGRSPPRQLRSLRALRQRRVPRARVRALRLRRVRGTPSRRPEASTRTGQDDTRSARARSARHHAAASSRPARNVAEAFVSFGVFFSARARMASGDASILRPYARRRLTDRRDIALCVFRQNDRHLVLNAKSLTTPWLSP